MSGERLNLNCPVGSTRGGNPPGKDADALDRVVERQVAGRSQADAVAVDETTREIDVLSGPKVGRAEHMVHVGTDPREPSGAALRRVKSVAQRQGADDSAAADQDTRPKGEQDHGDEPAQARAPEQDHNGANDARNPRTTPIR